MLSPGDDSLMSDGRRDSDTAAVSRALAAKAVSRALAATVTVVVAGMLNEELKESHQFSFLSVSVLISH